MLIIHCKHWCIDEYSYYKDALSREKPCEYNCFIDNDTRKSFEIHRGKAIIELEDYVVDGNKLTTYDEKSID